MVVFPILDVIPTHDADFAQVGILFPLEDGMSECYLLGGVSELEETYVEKVYFLEEFLFVVLELPDHDDERSDPANFLIFRAGGKSGYT